MTQDELATRIRSAFTRDGHWNADALARENADFWQEWIAARLRGQDPWIPYERDEHPATTPYLFTRFAEDAPALGVKTDACRQGAARFLASLDWGPSSKEPSHVLKNALYLVGKLRAREPEALRTLRDLIRHKKLLSGSEWPLELHRTALYALASLQVRGNDEDEAIWLAWLKPWPDAGQQHQYDFIPAAFSGLAVSRPRVPDNELNRVLELYKQARKDGHPMTLTPAILALWVDRESEPRTVREELWRAVQASPSPEEDWEHIWKCASRAWPCVKPYEEMQCLYPGAPSVWDAAQMPLWDRRARVA